MPNLNNADTLKDEDVTVMRLFDNIKRNFDKLAQGSKLHPDVSIYMPDYEVEVPFFTYKIEERKVKISLIPKLSKAVKTACQKAKKQDLILATGSLYTAKEVRDILK